MLDSAPSGRDARPHEPLAPIVVGVDRTGSAAAVDLGAAEALRTGRPLQLVHVAPTADGWLKTVGQGALRLASSRATAHVAGRVPVHRSLVRGDAVEELTAVAAGGALLVLAQLSARQVRRPGRMVTIAVAGRLDVPLVVVPSDWVGRRTSVVTIGYDPQAPDDIALRAAVVQTRLRNATLRVVVAGPRGDVDARLRAQGADACDTAVEVAIGDPTAALRQAALTSDLVVIGRHAPTAAWHSRLGTVGRAVLQDPPCPVLLTRPGHEHGGSASVAADSQVG